jgi:hypothetical protein
MSGRRILLKGLNGANPLGFMAALGCARLLSGVRPETLLGWDKHGTWRPVIGGFDSEAECVEALAEAARDTRAAEDLSAKLGDNIAVAPTVFRQFALLAALDPRWSGFAAAFGCDALKDKEKDRIQYTKLCFITGSGHQNFLETMRLLRQRTTEAHLRRTLFEGMEPADKGLSMRWDPSDAKEYALQWDNPGPEGVQSSWGAYRLAIEALPFFPTAPGRRWLKTTGFVSKDGRVEFQWPIWRDPIGVDAIRSLIGYQFVDKEMNEIREMGIEELFRSERVRIGEGANFKVSFRPARAV